MIDIIDKTKCSGCGSCFNVCPRHCITLKPDEEGFLYPYIEKAKCVSCGLCEKACPILEPYEKRNPINSFAIKHNEEPTRMLSSSGGFFPAMFAKIIEENGVVCAVEFDDSFETHHICVEDSTKLKDLIGSKYIQSRTECCYKQISLFLKAKRKTLFVGTPCQVAGLSRFLQVKKVDQSLLIKVELCCHGVPSPKIWSKYLKDNNLEPSNIQSVSFRSKVNGVSNYTLEIKSKDGKTISEGKNENSYMLGFLNNLFCRPTCSTCHFRQFATDSDISIGDFWAISTFYPEKDDNKGCNQVVVNTPKGKDFIGSLDLSQFDAFPITLAESYIGNTNYIKSSPQHPNRSLFWKMIKNGYSVDDSVKRSLYYNNSLKGFIKFNLYKIWKKLR